MKIKFNTNIIPLLLLFCCIAQFPWLPHSMELLLRYSCAISLLISYIKYIPRITIFIPLFGLLGVMFISNSLASVNINSKIASYMYILIILDIFLVVNISIKKNGLQKFCLYMFYVLLPFILLTDISILFFQKEFDSNAVYILGTKFQVVYFHIMFLTVFMQSHLEQKLSNSNGNDKIRMFGSKKKNYFLFIMLIITFIVFYRIKCGTGLVMLTVFIILCFSPKIFNKFITRPWILIFTFGLLNAIIFNLERILEGPLVQKIVTDILHKSLSLTGRTAIYSQMEVWIQYVNPYIGNGTYNSVVDSVVGYGNAQNGILNFFIQYGLLGVVALIYIIFLSAKIENKEMLAPFYVMLLSFFVASIVEISFGQPFFVCIAVIVTFRKTKIKFKFK